MITEYHVTPEEAEREQTEAQPEERPAPPVAVIIVSRNCCQELRQCLQDLEAQREEASVIVVDNGSSDGTQSLDAEFPWVNFLRLPKNFGFTRAANIGLKTASAEIILFLPPRSRVPRGAIQKMRLALTEHPEAGAVSPALKQAWRLPDERTLAACWASGQLPEGEELSFSEPLAAVEFPYNAPLMVYRRTVEAMNYLDARYGEHWALADLCARIVVGGKKIYSVREAEISSETPLGQDPADAADRALGAAVYIRKRRGFFAGLWFWLRAALKALLTGRLSVFWRILTWQKIDGS